MCVLMRSLLCRMTRLRFSRALRRVHGLSSVYVNPEIIAVCGSDRFMSIHCQPSELVSKLVSCGEYDEIIEQRFSNSRCTVHSRSWMFTALGVRVFRKQGTRA